MVENTATTEKKKPALSVKQTLLILYVLTTIAVAISGIWDKDAYFKIAGPLFMGFGASSLYGILPSRRGPSCGFSKHVG